MRTDSGEWEDQLNAARRAGEEAERRRLYILINEAIARAFADSRIETELDDIEQNI